MSEFKKVLLVLIFVGLLFLESTFNLSVLWRKVVLKVEAPFLNLSVMFVKTGKCITQNFGIKRTTLKDGDALNYSNGLLFVKGSAKEGDWVISKSGVILGKVIMTSGKLITVETPFSKSFTASVRIEKDGQVVYGKVIGGDPPLVEIAQDIDVQGWSVLISENERYGIFILSKGKGFFGKIKGKKGRFWLLDYRLVFESVEVVGM